MLEIAGYFVVEEAATDFIAMQQAQGILEPHTLPSFIDSITNLQKQRQIQASYVASAIQFFDRSPVCTYALSAWLGYPISITLSNEMERIRKEQIYERQVFFIENLGFCEPTQARRISFEDSLRFEKLHEETYRFFGYEIVRVAPQKLSDRVEQIKRFVSAAP
jgi:predicted ATPase